LSCAISQDLFSSMNTPAANDGAPSLAVADPSAAAAAPEALVDVEIAANDGLTSPKIEQEEQEEGSGSGQNSKHNGSHTGSATAAPEWKVPMVRLELDAVTYSPMTSSAQHTVKKNKKETNEARQDVSGSDAKTTATTATTASSAGAAGNDSTSSDAVSSTRTTVLHKVSTVVEPYKLTAWMVRAAFSTRRRMDVSNSMGMCNVCACAYARGCRSIWFEIVSL
jgi:hypothetical protein